MVRTSSGLDTKLRECNFFDSTACALRLNKHLRLNHDCALLVEELLTSLCSLVTSPFVIFTHDEHVVGMNPAASNLFGRNNSRDDIHISQLLDITPFSWQSDLPARQEQSTPSTLESSNQLYVVADAVHQSGSIKPVEIEVFPLSVPKYQLYIAQVKPIERKPGAISTEKMLMSLEQIADSIIITDRNGTIEYVNRGFEETTGYRRDDVIGKSPSIIKSGQHSYEYYADLWRTISEGDVYRGVVINKRKSGEQFYEEKTITPLKDATGHITHFISSGKDITERMQAKERLNYLAYHDHLTALPNRIQLLESVDDAIELVKGLNGCMVLMFIDLDRFKLINDTLGHEVGDMLLVEISARLLEAVGEEHMVARLSGDEFAVLINHAHSNIADQFAQSIIESINKPISTAGRELVVTCSIGIATYPFDGGNTHEILKSADIAMYRAKAEGRNNFEHYQPNCETFTDEYISLEIDLRRAVGRGELFLEYQPQISNESGMVCGAEALMRWNSVGRGVVPPSTFIPIMEEAGIIIDAGNWLIDEACRQMSIWKSMGVAPPSMAINISPIQFSDSGLKDHIITCVRKHQIKQQDIVLEVTESSLIDDYGVVENFLVEMTALGFGVAMDDFGTGYSSLGYLRKFPFTKLKIDRVFIEDMPGDKVACELLKGIVSMGKAIGLQVIAEGVESKSQYDFLYQNGCDAVQGYYCSRPLSAGMFEVYCGEVGIDETGR